VTRLDPKARVATLDGWRAIAVLLVIWHHFTRNLYSSEADYYRESVSRFGAFGVDIFFGISGLIITKLLVDEYSESGRISFQAFYVRRAFRILPPCFVYLATVLVAGLMKTPVELMASVLFFRNYIPAAWAGDATGHLWSLAVEEHFYLFWPVLLSVILARAGKKNAALATGWISIGCALWRVADAQNNFSARWLPAVTAHFRTDLRLDALLWGCAAALFLANPKECDRLQSGFRAWMLAIIVLLEGACAILYSQSSAKFAILVPLTFLGTLWAPILVPASLLGTVLHPQWSVSRLLDHPAMRFIGRMSYSLYLWQQIFLVPGWEHRTFLQHAPWNLALTVGCAFLSYRLIEKPCIALGRRLSDQIRHREVEDPLEPLAAGSN